jgi:hypothetical protein
MAMRRSSPDSNSRLNASSSAKRHKATDITQLAVCGSPANSTVKHVDVKDKRKQKDESLLAVLCSQIVDHQIGPLFLEPKNKKKI